jgi:hypothetical protein
LPQYSLRAAKRKMKEAAMKLSTHKILEREDNKSHDVKTELSGLKFA